MSSASSGETQTYTPRRIARHAALIVILLFGIQFTEAISNTLLPLTLRRFTPDAFLIGLVLAINPLCGFLVQPVVGFWSDRVWTRFGRRAVFLLVGAPVIALCLWLVPRADTFVQVVIVVVVLQVFHDVLFGSEHPLVADLIPARRRALVVGLGTVAAQIASVVVLRWGMPTVETHELANDGRLFGRPLYEMGAAIMLVCVFGGALLLREQRSAPRPTSRFTIKSYVGELTRNPKLLRLGIVNSFAAMIGGSQGFVLLFATQTLSLSKSDYGRGASWLPLSFIVVATVYGAAVRSGRRNLLMAGSLFLVVSGSILGWFSGELLELIFAQALVGVGLVTLGIVSKSFAIEFMPPSLFGQLSSMLNIFFGIGRTTAMVVVGFIVSSYGNDYRMIWPCIGTIATIGIFVVVSISDPAVNRKVS